MARVVIAATAGADLESIIGSHQLPDSTRTRVGLGLRLLVSFPLAGRPLGGRWSGLRLVLGPWPWMLVLYRYDEARNEVAVVTIQDARRATSVTSQGA